MKAVVLALVVGLLLFAMVSFRLRHLPPKEPARSLLRLYLVLLTILIIIFYTTPADLGFLKPQWVSPAASVELGFAVFLYSAGFFGGLLQLYNLADRGLSLRMLIDILDSPRGGMTASELTDNYAAGRGIVWMFEKRLDGMVYTGLAERRDGQFVLSARGRRLARLFAALRRFAFVDASGATP